MLTPWILVLSASGLVLGYPGGAPTSTCSDMMPRHGGSLAQASKSPFKLTPSATSVKVGAKVTVTLAGGEFQGFLLQALNAADKKVVGTFTQVPAGTKLMNCGTGNSNAVTHNSGSPKTTAALVWKAATNMAVGTKLIFRATVLQNFQTFWTKVDSSTVVVS